MYLLLAGDNDSDTTTAKEAGDWRTSPRRDQADGESCRRGSRGRGWTARTVLVDSWTDAAAAPGKQAKRTLRRGVFWAVLFRCCY